jgi:hypothetical protein
MIGSSKCVSVTSEDKLGAHTSRLPLPHLDLPFRFPCCYLSRAGVSWLSESGESGARTVDNTSLGLFTAF